MKSSAVFMALAVSALLLGLAAASCGCSSSGRDVCGGGCSRTVVRPTFIPNPRPVAVARKYVMVQEAPEPEPCYASAPAPAPAPIVVPQSEGCYRPVVARKERPQYYVPMPAAVPAPYGRAVYVKQAPVQTVQKVLLRQAPQAPQSECSSCYQPSSSCGCQ